MRLLTLAIGLLWATSSLSQQLPCDLVPEQQLPNCRFTTRSNYALHGSVHTFRVVQKDLSPDPRVQTSRAAKAPRLFLQEPGGYLAFSRTGDTIASGSVLSSGLPSQITLEKRIVEGPRTFICSGPPADPKASCREEVYAPDGDLTEGFAYDHGKLLAQTHHREDTGDWSEDFVYDSDGTVSSHSIERHDNHGRGVEWMVFDRDKLTLHQRNTYADCRDCDDDSALTSLSWYDAHGSMFREITLRDRVATSWWQRPACREICSIQHDGVGLNFPFEHTISYNLEPDGSLLTTIEHHPGRYGNIDNDAVELFDQHGNLLEKIAYRYVRDSRANWTERTASILDPSTRQLVDVRLDTRRLTYYDHP
jgi:hypothetical protein